jgi:nucleoside 2-deoxyribosyltransferase
MIVAGGTYREICEFPYDEQLFGSGLRSAAAVGEISTEPTELYTYISDNAENEVVRASGAYHFDFNPIEISDTITFHYIHNHSHPVQRTNVGACNRNLGPITGDAILRFGFVEGDAIVEGDRVVYDPQSVEEEGFYENGSQAQKLAIVLNRREARAFSGKDSSNEMLDTLTSGENGADVAVIKCGAAGAVVHADGDIVKIPLYETDTVWNIGSGDVFSSIFATYWAEQKLPAVEAARKASLGTAYFCSTRELPIPCDPKAVGGFEPIERESTIGQDSPTVYLAAPFFSVGDFWLMEEVQQILSEEGANVIAPYHDIGRADEYEDPTQVALEDLTAIENADAVLALIDTCDSGTYFELGYARKLDIPVVAYQNEPIQERTTMLEGASCEVYGDLSTAVFKTMWAA